MNITFWANWNRSKGTPSTPIHKFHSKDDGRCDRGHNFALI